MTFRALESAEYASDTCSALKNLAMSSWRLGETLQMNGEKETTVRHCYLEAIKHFSNAYIKGRIHSNAEWITNLSTAYYACIECLEGISGDANILSRARTMEGIVNNLNQDDPLRKGKCKDLATLYFKGAVIAVENKDYRSALSMLKEIYQPLQEALQAANKGRVHSHMICYL